MNPEIKQQWVNALRSGEYQQTTGTLRRETGFCCLGVLCDLAVKAEVISEPYRFGDPETDAPERVWYEYDAEPSVLTSKVQAWAGLRNESNPDVPYTEDMNNDAWQSRGKVSLAELNDNGYTFTQIADIIDANL